jgi:hypothetical protein
MIVAVENKTADKQQRRTARKNIADPFLRTRVRHFINPRYHRV